MKKGYLLHSIICLLAVSCTVQEIDTQTSPLLEGGMEDGVFYASLESFRTPETRVYFDEDVKLLWDAEDELSIFNKNTLNQQYLFSGQTGDNTGCFTRYSDPVEADNDMDFICAVYPYQESTTISDEGVLTLTLPENQEYREGSFGPGANVMVSTTDNNLLRFKNIGGYLALKFYGEGVSVSSIKLEGNNGEPLSGQATVAPAIGAIPEIGKASMVGTSITLSSDEPVVLKATAEESILFWIVVPPTDFEKGFTLTVTDEEGHVFTKRTNKSLSIARNSVLRIAPIEVVPENDDLDISITGVTPITDGINYNTPGASINHKVITDQANRAFTITMPTVTNFSQFVFNFGLSGEVDRLLANGKEIENGVTPIDATSPVTLTVCKGKYGKNYTLTARNTGLPVVRITTEGFTLADIEADPVHQTEWRPAVDENDNFVAGQNASISFEKKKTDGTVDCKQTTLQIKGRGNATWGYPKRPYALKLKEKMKPFDLGKKKHKRWILLANWKDRTLLRNDAAFWLSRHSGLPYTVDGTFVELEINGEHRGNYYLCEQIKIDKDNRVSIEGVAKPETYATDPLAVTGGYLMEIDNNWDALNSFWSGQYPTNPAAPDGSKTDIGGFNFKYQFKEPDEKDRTAQTYYYMTKFIAEMEEAIKAASNSNREYKDYFDTESAIRFMIVNELTGNGDFYNDNYSAEYKGPHSTYLFKDRDVLNEDGTTTVSKMHMGPVWDFDYLTFTPNQSSKWVGASKTNYYYYYLCRDNTFRTEMKQIWEATKNNFVGLPDYIEQQKEYIKLSAEFDGEMWWNTQAHGNKDQNQNGELNMSFDAAVERIKGCFNTKWSFMDNNIDKLNK